MLAPDPPPPPYEVLYVDRDREALRIVQQTMAGRFVLHCASSAWSGYQLLVERGRKIGVILASDGLEDGNGVEFLEAAGGVNPDLCRVLLCSQPDLQTAVDAINLGKVFRLLQKPCDSVDLALVLQEGLDRYALHIEREKLLLELVENSRNWVVTDRVRSMETLAEGLNHHFRNSLAAIRAFIELVPRKLQDELKGSRLKDDSFWTEWQAQALGQTDHIQGVLAKISSVAHLNPVERRDRVDLAGVLPALVLPYTRAFARRKIRLHIEIDEDLPAIVVNQDRFLQMWHLLLNHALAELRDGDDMHVDATTRFTGSAAEPGELFLKVRDNGPWPEGVSGDRLFDLFFSRSGHAVELGLKMAAVRGIVHQHDGSVSANPLPGGGLELLIRLPLQPSGASCPGSASLDEQWTCHQARWAARERRQPWEARMNGAVTLAKRNAGKMKRR
jgi:signal transduction histidine kinase